MSNKELLLLTVIGLFIGVSYSLTMRIKSQGELIKLQQDVIDLQEKRIEQLKTIGP